MMEINEKNLSEWFYIMKAVAILTVICAHCNLKVDNYIGDVLKNIGTIGVGIFLFSSGFYFNLKNFHSLKHKFVKTFIPWTIASSIIWLEIGIRNRDLSIKSYLFHLIGNGSVFYFFTVYFVIQSLAIILLNKIKLSSKSFFVVALITNIIANILENNSISIFSTPLLNPFVFISYFAVGYLLGEDRSTFIKYCNQEFLYVGIVAFFVLLIPGFTTYYWNGVIEIILELLFIMGAMGLSRVLLKCKYPIADVERNTLFIYIWHLLPMTIVNYVGNKVIFFKHIVFVWPIVVLFVMICALYCLKKLKNKIPLWILGVTL